MLRIITLLLLLLCAPAQAFFFRHHGGGAPSGGAAIVSVQLSGTAVQFGATGPYYVGTLTTNVSPATPTFNNLAGATYQLVTSGGSCSGGDTTHFQITGDGIYTNTLLAGTYKLCVTAAATGFTSVTTTFTGVTEGHKVDAAAAYCAANGGGDGSSATPWQAACIQAAVNAAVTGDTVFLAAGYWDLPIGGITGNISASSHVISSLSSTVGISAGQTVYDNTNLGFLPSFTTVSAVNGACGSNCVTLNNAATSNSTGDIFSFQSSTPPVTITSAISLVGAGSGNTFSAYGNPNYSSALRNNICTGATITITCLVPTGADTRFGPGGFVQFSGSCSNTAAAHISIDGSTKTAGGGTHGILNFLNCTTGPATVTDLHVLNFNSTSIASESQFSVNQSNNITVQSSIFTLPIDINNASFYAGNEVFSYGIGNTTLIKNNVFYQGQLNPIDVDSVTYTGNVDVMKYDGVASPGVAPSFGITGCSLSATCSPNGGTTGTYHFTTSNNLFDSSDRAFGTGGGINDPSTGGGVSDLNWTGNWVLATTGSIAGCVWHVFGNCPSGSIGSADGNQINATGGPSGNCTIAPSDTCFNITNNSIVGTTAAILDATGNGITSAGAPLPNHTNTTANFNATKNYLTSTTNQYLHDAGTVNPSVVGNFCVTSTFTQTDSSTCATSGFVTLPTVSFTPGLLQIDGSTGLTVIPINSPAFTAQYGAVQWLASTLSTPPTSGGQTGTGCNGSACTWSRVPPVELVGAAHGNTLYLWVMDSLNHISAAASALIP